MKFFLILASVLVPLFGQAQSDKTVLGTFAMGCKVYNYEFKKLSNGLFSFNVGNVTDTNNAQVTKTYSLNEFKQEPFLELCVQILKEYENSILPECKKGVNINSLALEIYYEVKLQIEFNDDEPTTAYLKLKNSFINCYYSKDPRIRNSKSDNDPILTKFSVENIDIEFEDGTIKNIFAYLIPIDNNSKPLLNGPICFKNTSPLSVSSRNDNDNFSEYNIYASDFKGVRNKIKLSPLASSTPKSYKLEASNTSSSSDDQNINNIYFVLSEMIDYINVLETNKEDYSPVNSVVSLSKNNPIQILRKEKRSKILMARAFSDLFGIPGNEPNGLLQVEVSRKFNLSTKKFGNKYFYWGMFNYIEPKFSFSRIEENDNPLYLDLSNIDKSSLIFTVNPIEILRYQKSAFDIDLNLYKYNFPEIKSNIHANFSIGITRSLVTDSIAVVGTIPKISNINNATNLSTFRYGMSILYNIKPDSRYGITFSYDIKAYNSFNDNYVSGVPLIDSEFLNNTVHSFGVDAFLEIDKNNSIFFKYKLSTLFPTYNGHFIQIQIGYQADLFKVSK